MNMYVVQKVVILKILVLVDWATPVVTGGNSKYGLIPHVPEFCGQEKLAEQLFCQKYNKESVYSATKQTRVLLIKKPVNNCPFSIIVMNDHVLKVCSRFFAALHLTACCSRCLLFITPCNI